MDDVNSAFGNTAAIQPAPNLPSPAPAQPQQSANVQQQPEQPSPAPEDPYAKYNPQPAPSEAHGVDPYAKYNPQPVQQASENSAKQPTGFNAVVPEVSKQFNEGMSSLGEGTKELTALPSIVLQKLATGTVDPDTIKTYLAHSQPSDLIKALAKMALGAQQAITSPLEGEARAFIGNPVENATGIPSGLTTSAVELGIPLAAGAKAKALEEAQAAKAALEERIAGLKEKPVSSGMTSAPTEDLSTSVLKNEGVANQPIEAFKNAPPAKDQPVQANVKEDVAKLYGLNKEIERLQKIGSVDPAGKAQLDALNEQAEQLREKLVGPPREIAPTPVETATPTPAAVSNGHPTRNALKEQDATQQMLGEQAAKNVPLSEQLRNQSSAKYNSIGNSVMPPTTMNKFITDIKMAHPEDAELAEAIGQKPEQKLIAGLENLRDKPLPLQRAKAIYEELGEKADKNVLDNGHLTNEGRVYQDMQSKLWDAIQGTPGTAEWQQAKKDWQQSIKLGQLEKMYNKASSKGQPANSLNTAVNNFVADPSKTRGWSDDEIQALKEFGNRDLKDKMLEAAGSKLLSHITGTVVGGGLGSMLGGPLGAATGAVAGDVAAVAASSAARNASLAKAGTKLNKVKATILKNTSTKGEGLLGQLKDKK